jgi:hypothetical protein
MSAYRYVKDSNEVTHMVMSLLCIAADLEPHSDQWSDIVRFCFDIIEKTKEIEMNRNKMKGDMYDKYSAIYKDAKFKY